MAGLALELEPSRDLLGLYEALDSARLASQEVSARLIATEALSLGSDRDYARLEILQAQRAEIQASIAELEQWLPVD